MCPLRIKVDVCRRLCRPMVHRGSTAILARRPANGADHGPEGAAIRTRDPCQLRTWAQCVPVKLPRALGFSVAFTPGGMSPADPGLVFHAGPRPRASSRGLALSPASLRKRLAQTRLRWIVCLRGEPRGSTRKASMRIGGWPAIACAARGTRADTARARASGRHDVRGQRVGSRRLQRTRALEFDGSPGADRDNSVCTTRR